MRERTLKEWEEWLAEDVNNANSIQHVEASKLDDFCVHNSILHLAVLRYWLAKDWDDSTLVELLLNEGANPNAQNDLGKTPLHLACEFDTLSAKDVEILLRYGANPSIKDNLGETPFDKLFGQKNETQKIRSILVQALKNEMN